MSGACKALLGAVCIRGIGATRSRQKTLFSREERHYHSERTLATAGLTGDFTGYKPILGTIGIEPGVGL